MVFRSSDAVEEAPWAAAILRVSISPAIRTWAVNTNLAVVSKVCTNDSSSASVNRWYSALMMARTAADAASASASAAFNTSDIAIPRTLDRPTDSPF